MKTYNPGQSIKLEKRFQPSYNKYYEQLFPSVKVEYLDFASNKIEQISGIDRKLHFQKFVIKTDEKIDYGFECEECNRNDYPNNCDSSHCWAARPNIFFETELLDANFKKEDDGWLFKKGADFVTYFYPSGEVYWLPVASFDYIWKKYLWCRSTRTVSNIDAYGNPFYAKGTPVDKHISMKFIDEAMNKVEINERINEIWQLIKKSNVKMSDEVKNEIAEIVYKYNKK